MKKLFRVYISPSKGGNKISSWKEKIEEYFGPLSGYLVDLKEKSIEDILLEILQLKEEGILENQNYLNIQGVYLNHVRSLQDNLDKEDDTLKQEITILESKGPSRKTVDILIKYGILSGIYFYIPYEKVYKEYKDIMGENVFKGTNVEAPYKEYWDKTFKNLDYIPNKETSVFKHEDIRLQSQVLIFSKAKHELYDITNFLSEIITSVNLESGGNFKLKMHLVSSLDLKGENNRGFQDNNINVTGYKKALFLQSIFRENDIVFIRFESLKCEKAIQNKKIKGYYWDMIGLIDTLSIFSDFNSFDINISGRDLIKLVIDDNNFFIPYQWANNPNTVLGGDNSHILKRLFSTGEYTIEFVRAFRSIENSIGFILSQLTHIEVLSEACIDFLVKEYENDLSKQYTYSQAGKKEESLKINGIWGLVNYYVDEKISNLRLADSSLKSPSGSTMQQILKICQAPFIEIIADTFVDKYNFIIRKPPFTIEDIAKQNFLIIERSCSIRDTLEFSREVYTVYQLIPQGGCFADNSSIALSYLPMIVLDDYTRLWGNKLYSQVYNYLDIDTYNQLNDEKKQQVYLKEVFFETLIWLIETTAYLPFSRTGQIIIKGDRRIKVGQWIYYEKTNEVFYVNSVSNSISINNGVDRITTLNVSRGLVKDYIIPTKKKTKDYRIIRNNSMVGYGVKEIDRVEVSNMSYSNLIDIDLLREGLKEFFVKENKDFSIQRETKKGDTFISNSSIVISEVFDFFLKGKQFEGEVSPHVFYYNKSAMTLDEIKEQQKGQNGNGYSMSISSIESSEEILEEPKKFQKRKPKNNSITKNDEFPLIFSSK